MPEISRFYGIVIKMFHNDHWPPHIHAEYGGAEMLVGIDTLSVIAGKLPPRATGLVMEWAAQHQIELQRAWSQARHNAADRSRRSVTVGESSSCASRLAFVACAAI